MKRQHRIAISLCFVLLGTSVVHGSSHPRFQVGSNTPDSPATRVERNENRDDDLGACLFGNGFRQRRAEIDLDGDGIVDMLALLGADGEQLFFSFDSKQRSWIALQDDAETPRIDRAKEHLKLAVQRRIDVDPRVENGVALIANRSPDCPPFPRSDISKEFSMVLRLTPSLPRPSSTIRADRPFSFSGEVRLSPLQDQRVPLEAHGHERQHPDVTLFFIPTARFGDPSAVDRGVVQVCDVATSADALGFFCALIPVGEGQAGAATVRIPGSDRTVFVEIFFTGESR